MKRCPSSTRAASSCFPVPIDRFARVKQSADMLVLNQLRQSSNHPALRCGSESLSYAELDRWSSALAGRLARETRPQSDTPIGILAPSGLPYFAALLAVWKTGAMAVPLQPAHPAEELQHIISDAGLKTVLLDPSIQTQLKGPEFVPVSPSSAGEPELHEPSPRAGALMIYTSGTTGKPKGVVTPYSALDAQISALLQAWEWNASDRTLNILPLHHVHGVVVLSCCALAAGASMELAPKFSPELVWDRIARAEINVFMAVPTVYAKLVQHWEKQTSEVRRQWTEAAGRMRLTVSGSAALPVPLFEAWKKIAGRPLLERYGMTEIGMALSNPYRGERQAGRVGFPLPGVETRLSTEGELQVRGPGVFREYWRNPEATRAGFTPDGWFRTGDIAETDAQGSFRLLGRSSQDIIKTGGYKVSALEIENVLLEHPDVKEAAVVGIADPVWGERVAAAVVTGLCSLNEQNLANFAALRLAKYKVPTAWRQVESLPRNSMGKVIKTKVREIFG
jgi:malonyl-CoA/methylmalonyl-CoA synthetase